MRLKKNVESLKSDLATATSRIAPLKEQHNRVISWANIFDSCDLDTKRMIICQLINRIVVSKGYKIDIELNMTAQQYLACLNEETIELSVA